MCACRDFLCLPCSSIRQWLSGPILGSGKKHSDQTLIAVSDSEPDYAEVIPPGKRLKIVWHNYCQAFDIGGKRRYSHTDVYVPEAEMFDFRTIKLAILYKDSTLYFDGKGHGLTAIEEIGSCEGQV